MARCPSTGLITIKMTLMVGHITIQISCMVATNIRFLYIEYGWVMISNQSF
jgi:hypothetical protein